MAITPYTRNMNQEATYWSPGQNDGMGGLVYGAPVLVRCRWQDRVTLVRNAQGAEVPSRSVIYVDRKLEPQGMLLEGDHTGVEDPLSVRASEILSVGSSPNLRATQELHKVWL